MKKALHLQGVIRDLKYEPQLKSPDLPRFRLESFDVNAAAAAGFIEFEDGSSLPYSKWKSPKPSRTYPSASMYKVYHCPKPLAVIPILKDEGAGSQNNDRLTYTTYSRMNLLNIHVILAWYESGEPHHARPNRIQNQLLNSSHVRELILEAKKYKQSAMHWNRMHFERDFAKIFRRAVNSYVSIGAAYDLEMNSADNHLALLEQYLHNGEFKIDLFARYSGRRSASAAKREAMTVHELEHLADGDKAYFDLVNWLGGTYHVTADEVYWEDGKLIIQESKNTTTAKLPAPGDIRDGLFKNILFHNIDELRLGDERIDFATRLKLTGLLSGRLKLPAEATTIEQFVNANELRAPQRELIESLDLEVRENPGFSIEIAGNR